MKRLTFILFLVIVVIGVVGVGVASAKTTNFWSDIDWPYVKNDCGEPIHVQGKMHIVYKSSRDEAGGYHYTFHENLHGTGTGRHTGNEYVYNNSFNYFYNSKSPQNTHAGVRKIHLVSKGDDPNMLLKYNYSYTYNANGELTANFYNYEIACN